MLPTFITQYTARNRRARLMHCSPERAAFGPEFGESKYWASMPFIFEIGQRGFQSAQKQRGPIQPDKSTASWIQCGIPVGPFQLPISLWSR